MEPRGFQSLSYDDVVLIVKGQFGPAKQALIDKRFRTLVRNELSKKFGSELELVSNLEEIINDGKSLREIRMKVQFEISPKKINR